EAVPGRATATDRDALSGESRPAAAIGGSAPRGARRGDPRTAQGPGPDAGPDGAANRRIARLFGADRTGQELRVQRNPLLERAGPAGARRGSVPGDSAGCVVVSGEW